jgi:hypothetical protein
MSTTIPPAPFPGKGVTLVQPLPRLPVTEMPPLWGGPAEAT